MEIIREIAKTLYKHTYAKSHNTVIWDRIPVSVEEYWYGQALQASHLYMEWTHAYPRVLEPLPLGEEQGWSIKTSDISKLVNEWKNIIGRDPLICGESSAPDIYQKQIKEIHRIFLFGPSISRKNIEEAKRVMKRNQLGIKPHIK